MCWSQGREYPGFRGVILDYGEYSLALPPRPLDETNEPQWSGVEWNGLECSGQEKEKADTKAKGYNPQHKQKKS